MNNINYVIMVIGLGWYTLLLGIGITIAAIREKREREAYRKFASVLVGELKELLHEEEFTMENSRKHEEGKFSVQNGLLGYCEAKEEPKELTLTDMLAAEPTDEDYDVALNILTRLAQRTYGDYKFYIAKSQDEPKQAHFLQMSSYFEENADLHKALFKKAIDTNIDQLELSKRFAQRVADGTVLPLGDDVAVIIVDGTNQLTTGVSAVNSGLEGSEIRFNVSFLQKKNLEEWEANNLKKEEKEDA
jgi:hypothetical protein